MRYHFYNILSGIASFEEFEEGSKMGKSNSGRRGGLMNCDECKTKTLNSVLVNGRLLCHSCAEKAIKNLVELNKKLNDENVILVAENQGLRRTIEEIKKERPAPQTRQLQCPKCRILITV